MPVRVAELFEGLARERGEDAVRGVVHEVEREVATAQGVGEQVERMPAASSR